MPTNVLLFERLMYASLSVGLLNVAWDGPRVIAAQGVDQAGGVPYFVAIVLGTFGVLALLIWLIARRQKDWARWLLVGMFILGLMPFLENMSGVIEANPLVASLSVAQLVLQAAALYFVFSADAAPWFAKPRKA